MRLIHNMDLDAIAAVVLLILLIGPGSMDTSNNDFNIHRPDHENSSNRSGNRIRGCERHCNYLQEQY